MEGKSDNSPRTVGYGECWAEEGKTEERSAATHGFTATRFVLPFVAEWAPAGKADAIQSGYRAARTKDWIRNGWDPRKGYLTKETRGVLFGEECADWLMWEGAPPWGGKWRYPIKMFNEQIFEVELRPPALVLFQDQGAENRRKDGTDNLNTGFLVVELIFHAAGGSGGRGPFVEDVLLFNELFRYFALPYDKHRAQFATMLSSLEEWMGGRGYEKRWTQWLEGVRVDLGDSRGARRLKCRIEQITNVHADQRAFVWSRMVLRDDAMRQALPDMDDPRSTESPPAKITAVDEEGFRLMFGLWVKLLNVDKPALNSTKDIATGFENFSTTNSYTAFEREWCAPRTYRRWEHCSCYYGFCDFSGAMLTGPNDEPPAWQHWFGMYFDQLVLLLYVRCTLFRLSGALVEVSKQAAAKRWRKSRRELLREFGVLRRQFTIFENLYQFPLLSNQQQALEMYALLRRNLSIDELYLEVSKEVQNSDSWVNGVEDSERNEMAGLLNAVAFTGLALSILLAALQTDAIRRAAAGGWNTFWSIVWTTWQGWGLLLLLSIIPMFLSVMFSRPILKVFQILSGKK